MGALGVTRDRQADFKGKYLDTLADNHLDDARHDIDFHTNMTAAAAADHRTHFSIRSNATYQTVRARAVLPRSDGGSCRPSRLDGSWRKTS
jgi:hypothetical protein